ncbi:MAG: hypothetical protein ABSA23_10105 [Anaerolineales bacterium]
MSVILQDSAIIAQAGEKKGKEQFQELQQEMQTVTCPINLMLAGKIGKVHSVIGKALKTVKLSLKWARELSIPTRPPLSNGYPSRVNG